MSGTLSFLILLWKQWRALTSRCTTINLHQLQQRAALWAAKTRAEETSRGENIYRNRFIATGWPTNVAPWDKKSGRSGENWESLLGSTRWKRLMPEWTKVSITTEEESEVKLNHTGRWKRACETDRKKSTAEQTSLIFWENYSKLRLMNIGIVFSSLKRRDVPLIYFRVIVGR